MQVDVNILMQTIGEQQVTLKLLNGQMQSMQHTIKTLTEENEQLKKRLGDKPKVGKGENVSK